MAEFVRGHPLPTVARNPASILFKNRVSAFTEAMDNSPDSKNVGRSVEYVGTSKRNIARQGTEHHITAPQYQYPGGI
jgi:hypothetical protein